MSVESHFLLSSKELEPLVDILKFITKSTASLVEEKVQDLGNIDVVFYNNPGATFKEIGLGGYTPVANTVFISLDLKHPHIGKSVEEDLPYMLAHEFNHAIRFRTPIQRETLFEAMISEGLADHFAIEILGAEKKPQWVDALTEEQKKYYFEIISKEWDVVPYDHNAWFYGSVEKNIPRWTAYTLGFQLVEDYIEKHSNVLPSQLISVAADIFKKS